MSAVAQEYVEAVLRRGREPMEPIGFSPDWEDRPARHKFYPGVWRLPLPEEGTPRTGMMGDLLVADSGEQGLFDLSGLSTMLQHSYGLLARRMRPNGNDDSHLLPWHGYASWGRGTASGGGLYPVEIYLAAGSSGQIQPGIYHYSPPHHALDRLLAGDMTARIRAAAQHHAPARDADQFLLLSVQFWKNSFKYSSFCYHVVTMDIGTVLGTWDLWCRSRGMRLEPAFWFDEVALNDLLGLDTIGESVFAVVPLRWETDGAGPITTGLLPGGVGKAERERSREVVRFPQIEAVHAAIVAEGARPPDFSRLTGDRRAGDACLPLPTAPAELRKMRVSDALRARRSSFGCFSGSPPLDLENLGGVLSLTATTRLISELPHPLTRLALFVNHVEGLEQGAYDYDRNTHTLTAVEHGPVGRFLQWNYFLRNYNLEQAAAVIAVLASPREVMSTLGDRAYRLVNAEVGAITQSVYVACAAAGLGCGAVLGFDNVSVRERLRSAEGEWPLILVMLGHERAQAPDIDYRLTI
ncbi:SagB family peptide dehydrogenase [Nonomuraea sp. NPDC050404]|uniref:SagB family peptide dehydrogenase n=1 Tax=Nonomuraea sp. NPDC050404 TaxID=3155783 RepID=UPI0033D6BC53